MRMRQRFRRKTGRTRKKIKSYEKKTTKYRKTTKSKSDEKKKGFRWNGKNTGNGLYLA